MPELANRCSGLYAYGVGHDADYHTQEFVETVGQVILGTVPSQVPPQESFLQALHHQLDSPEHRQQQPPALQPYLYTRNRSAKVNR